MIQAYRSLRSRPLESVLLILTIMFGVALSSLVLSAAWPGLGSGTSTAPGLDGRELTIQTRDNDWNQFYRVPNAPPVARVGRVGDKPITLVEADMGKLKAAAPAVKYAYLSDFTSIGDWSKGREAKGVSSEYLPALGATLVAGAFPNATEYSDRKPVVVLTEYAAKFLFPKKPALGQRIEGFRVIGIMKVPKDQLYAFRSAEQSQYGSLGIMPYGATVQQANVTYNQGPIQTLHFAPVQGRESEATAQLSQALLSRWGDRVTVASNAQQNAEYSKAYRRGSLSLAALGLGGLLVASLSVLALMLARVLSRQRQLGMAAALGASRGRLRTQYLLEVMTLGVLGSVLGGVLAAGLIWWLNRGVTGPFGASLSLQPWVLVGTVLASVVLSVLFGLAPAIQASRVRPAEALRA